MFVFDCANQFVFFFFKQKTAYEMRISDWSSDVCSSDLKLIESQTRMSVQIGLTYAPRPRTTITLDGFVGNVATYRTGVQSREDMRFRLGINQEIRHHLTGRLGILYRRSKSFGVEGTPQQIGRESSREQVGL